MLNPLGDKIVDSFFEKDNEFLDFIDFARTFAVFRPVKDSTPKDAVNSRDAKVKSANQTHQSFCGHFSSIVFF